MILYHDIVVMSVIILFITTVTCEVKLRLDSFYLLGTKAIRAYHCKSDYNTKICKTGNQVPSFLIYMSIEYSLLARFVMVEPVHSVLSLDLAYGFVFFSSYFRS